MALSYSSDGVMDQCLQFIVNNSGLSCKLVATIQSNNGVRTVSKTGVESIESVACIFKIIGKNDLQTKAALYGLTVFPRKRIFYLTENHFLLTNFNCVDKLAVSEILSLVL
ncbi:hypothetical protein [Spirosoma foliorum]|uniref:Uncharacterized protein n=1 Tax=Spirosoma foliorum TaxID=2710596 RepID=A0A7G5H6G9_9BACT|nr:hypothetical protein [Spirosoma foliorum]QMW06711.1 hypothetical protein H3H32_18365 [Spirosoma foliorum]